MMQTMIIGRVFPLLLLSAFPIAPVAAKPCTLVDALTPALAIARGSTGPSAAADVAAFGRNVIARFPGLYEPGVLGIADPAERDAKIAGSLDTLRADPAIEPTRAAVAALMPMIADVDGRTFPDFRCDFPIYLMDSLGQLDGAGRIVGGRPALVIGIDVLATENPAQRPVFLAHEFFHRYHARAAGFSDDAGEAQILWRVLWAEGLATYMSLKLTQGATLSDALLLPDDLETRARPKLPRIAALLTPHLDEIDPIIYRLLFTYGGKDATIAGLPWRSGYYLGYRVAEELGKTRSLAELAHLRGPALRHAIGGALAVVGAEAAPD